MIIELIVAAATKEERREAYLGAESAFEETLKDLVCICLIQFLKVTIIESANLRITTFESGQFFARIIDYETALNILGG